MEVFGFQYRHNFVYRNYCQLLDKRPEAIHQLSEIPFLPISAFKHHEVSSAGLEAEIVFESSGTSSSINSKHLITDLDLYRQSFQKAFELFYGKASDYTILALLPSYLERKGSSLVYMVNDLIESSQKKESGFFLHNHSELYEQLNQLAQREEKTLLIGVSFGLLDFAEKYQVKFNPHLIVMETGGMKGKRKELIREELHQTLQAGFNIPHIHSEYGMTELLSQAYSKGGGSFHCPPWMKVLIRKQDDPFTYATHGSNGAINIIDLANVYSCSFIQTDDLGQANKDGSFKVLGRFDRAAVRGCNLMIS